jgi:hypothetical protein
MLGILLDDIPAATQDLHQRHLGADNRPLGYHDAQRAYAFPVSILLHEQVRVNKDPLRRILYLGAYWWRSASGHVMPISMPGPRERHLFGSGWVFVP